MDAPRSEWALGTLAGAPSRTKKSRSKIAYGNQRATQRQARSLKCHEQCIVTKDQQGARSPERPARNAGSIELRLPGSEQRKTVYDQRALTSEK